MRTTNDDLTRRDTLKGSERQPAAASNEPIRKVLTIERAKWRRGGGLVLGETLLYNPLTKRMCCLGFDALACGVPLENIRNAGDPGDVRFVEDFTEYAAGRLVDGDASQLQPAVTSAIKHNDDRGLTDDERERLIRMDLIDLGWDDVVFV